MPTFSGNPPGLIRLGLPPGACLDDLLVAAVVDLFTTARKAVSQHDGTNRILKVLGVVVNNIGIDLLDRLGCIM